MENYNSIIILTIFKNMRVNLIDDFKNQAVEIYEPSFKYENDFTALSIATEKYFITWLDKHYSHFDNILSKSNYSNKTKNTLRTLFIDTYLKLTDSFMHYSISNSDSSELTRKILKEKAGVLKDLLEASDISDEKISKLRFVYQKDRVLFSRLLKKFSSEEDDV